MSFLLYERVQTSCESARENYNNLEKWVSIITIEQYEQQSSEFEQRNSNAILKIAESSVLTIEEKQARVIKFLVERSDSDQKLVQKFSSI